jgi:hypothetical protein
MKKTQELLLKMQVVDVLAHRRALTRYEMEYGRLTEGASELRARLRSAEQTLLGMVITYLGADHETAE